MTASAIIWSTGTRIDRALGRIANRLAMAFGRFSKSPKQFSEDDFLAAKRIRAATASVELKRDAAFADTYSAPSASADELRKIIDNDRSRISPLPGDQVIIIASKTAGVSGEAALIHVKPDRLERIEAHAAKLGLISVSVFAEDAPEQPLPTPRTTGRSLGERRFFAIALLIFLAGTWGALTALNTRAEKVQNQLEVSETLLRTQLLERRTHERDIGALGELAKLDPETRSPQGRLAQLERLVSATPTPTWWTELNIEDGVVTINAQSPNAGETLFGLTQAMPDLDVRFAAAVSDTSDGQQIFTIRIARKGGAVE